MRLAAAPSASRIHMSHCRRVGWTVSEADKAMGVLLPDEGVAWAEHDMCP